VAAREFSDQTDAAGMARHRLEDELAATPADLLVLSALSGLDSFLANPEFNETAWQRAVTPHVRIANQLERLARMATLTAGSVRGDCQPARRQRCRRKLGRGDDGDILSRTSEDDARILVDIDLAAADKTKLTHPRNVRNERLGIVRW